ncbi:MAG: hypothetical protein COT74_13295 [Bdellovibrionales bacterium CG10_big_fil_rev_8_21_14_0_10_45_34]|nr:MAG: hypothetical protein COT74_13295 [Bdellovibrionales bacterium CG10_big_fil_rev_8_21_14_0_10_45_34]
MGCLKFEKGVMRATALNSARKCGLFGKIKILRPLVLVPLVLGCLTVRSAASSSDLSEQDNWAMQQTLKLLQDPGLRTKAVNENSRAKGADTKVQELMQNDPEKVQRLYEISAKVFERMTKQNSGDSSALAQQVDPSKINAEDFANNLTEEERKMIRELASEFENKPVK